MAENTVLLNPEFVEIEELEHKVAPSISVPLDPDTYPAG